MKRIALLSPATTGIQGQPLALRDSRFTDDWVIRWHDTASERAKSLKAPELAVYQLSNIVVFGAASYLATRSGDVLFDDRFCLDFVKDAFNRDQSVNKRTSLRIRVLPDSLVVYQGHGVNVYGHVLLEMLPRLALLKLAGFNLGELVYLIRVGTPEWHIELLKAFFGIAREQLVTFDHSVEQVSLSNAIVPTLPRGSGGVHPAAALLFDAMVADLPVSINRQSRQLVIERPGKPSAASYQRTLENYRDATLDLPQDCQRLLVEPGSMPISDQVAAFRYAESIVGEYGSALHNVAFSLSAPLCLCIGHINLLQSSLCAMRDAPIAYFSVDLLARGCRLDLQRFREFYSAAMAARGRD